MRMDFKTQGAPMVSRKTHRQVFLTMAAAELALLSVLILFFTYDRLRFDVITLSAVLLVGLAVGSWMIRRSVMLAQVVFLISLITLEVFLMANPPFSSFSVVAGWTVTPDYLPVFFLIIDLAVLWYFLLRQVGLEGDEADESGDSKQSSAAPQD